jgi:uncharacterized RDD family membrane protein YckC
VSPLPESAANTDFVYRPIAGFWRRVLAIYVDCIIIGVLELVVIVALGGMLIGLHPMWTRSIGMVGITAYFTILNSHIGEGQTIGKRLLKIRVVGEDGHTISLLKAAARALIYLLPAVLTTYGVYFPVVIPNTELVVPYLALLGNVICIFTVIVFLFNTQARQTVHDILCKTYVVEAWTSGGIAADKAEPAMLAKCGLAAVLIVVTPWAVQSYRLYQALQFDSVARHTEALRSLVSIPDVISVDMNYHGVGRLTYALSYIGKQSPQEVAEQAAALLAPSTLEESVTIVTARYLDLVGFRYGEETAFHLQQGRPLVPMSWHKGLSLGPFSLAVSNIL